ncbi:DUF742 domain-containing protein [Streptomyces sp. NBC_00820]|uniref:DUF742 domain-containing protein n=1 Tax=Streptomyces sp. NBC_00820 TaxID=2975842 RepID=UPI002ED36F60|nr:DUF742 domain-containing protein [Streptomyces sp. NBC_00820]
MLASDHGPSAAGSGPPRLRPYSVTGGRTHPRVPLERTTVIKAPLMAVPPPPEALERSEAFAMCRAERLTITEIAWRLRLPVQAAKVVVGDLIHEQFLMTVAVDQPDAKAPEVLERVLAGLQAL